MAFIKKQRYEKNGLTKITIMKNEEAYDRYILEKKDLANNLSIKREDLKGYIREFFQEHSKQLEACAVNISYMTDEGLQYLEPLNTPQEISQGYINSMLMKDPVDTHLPSDGGNVSSLTGKRIYGVTIFYMKIPSQVQQKATEAAKTKYKKPVFKPSLEI